jgi:transposase
MKRGKDLPLSAKEGIISMNRLEKLSPKRIAEKLDISINTVKTIIRKANKTDREGATPIFRGRPLTDSDNTEKLIERLQMENRLLRDFLQLVGRK